jgi:4-amino-4-deoxy-L-arabinose transferase-like glycosyltransferase
LAEARDLTMPPGGKARLRFPALSITRERWIDGSSLLAVTTVALVINAWRLADNGYGNTYYAAAVRSMTFSWRNFFFAAFDPGGFISADKPPVFLWVGALSARVFGYSPWAILLPSAIAGAASVALLWLLVRKYFGVFAATVAALAFALCPITVAVNRLNLPEPFMILVLLGGAGAILQSFGSKRWWWAWMALAGCLVGIGFNIKMLAAWIPGPAMALAVVAALPRFTKRDLIRTGASLGILAVATFAVSASWMVIVDNWPASERPYVGGSSDNSVQNLALDYNGVGRVDGEERPGGAPPVNLGRGGFPGNVFGAGNTGRAGGGNPVPQAGPANGRGGIIAGTPGLWRMFDDANGPQIAWLLPLALLTAPISLWRWRNHAVIRAAVVLFAGWVLLFGGVFSYAQGIYHSYYTSALMPGIAALVGIGVVATIDLAKKDTRWLIAFVPAVWATAMVQLHQADQVPNFYESLPWLSMGIVVGGAMAACLLAFSKSKWGAAPGFAVVVAGLLLTPAAWSTYEARHPSLNTTLPQAGPREGAAGRSFGSQAFDGGVATLASWLDQHQDPDTRWDLAVTSAQNASTLIAAYQMSVMAIGGFSGTDPSISVSQFADYVNNDEIHYVLVTQGGPGGLIGGFPGQTNGTFPGGNFGGGGAGNTPPGTLPGTGALPNGGNVRNQPNNGFPQNTPQRAPNTGRGGFTPNGTANGGQVPAFPNRNGGAGPTQNNPAPNAQNPGLGQQKGANAVMSAVRQVCTPVTGADAPTGYSGSLYDCTGKGAALKALG